MVKPRPLSNFFLSLFMKKNLKLFCRTFLYRIQYSDKQKTVECLSFSLFLSNRKFRQVVVILFYFRFCRCYHLFPVLRNKSATKFMNTINYKKRRKPRIDCFVKKEQDPRFTTIPFKPLTDEK